MKIAVLGAGKMGLSFSKSFLKYELIKPENLILITRSPEKKDKIRSEFPNSQILCFDEVENLDASLVIIAVKPQDFGFVVENLPFSIPDSAMILSIMAGISIEKIQRTLNHQLVVRAMPNSPTLLGMGITGYTAAPGIAFDQLMQVERLMNSTGRSVYLPEESLLDGVTALSGSGPAYFYYIVDAMVKAGVEMGIEENLSKLFVEQTMLGAYHLINNSEKSLEELIKDVASKGGTTEAALKTFNDNKLKDILISGIIAAENRAKELEQLIFMDFETSLDKSIDFALDYAIRFLDVAQEFYPFSFLIDSEGKIISIKPGTEDEHLDSSGLVDDFKDFGNQKIAEDQYSGFCVTYNIKLNIEEKPVDAIAIFLKFSDDFLPLKTRVYYFPYTFDGEKPYIDFNASFSSEA